MRHFRIPSKHPLQAVTNFSCLPATRRSWAFSRELCTKSRKFHCPGNAQMPCASTFGAFRFRAMILLSPSRWFGGSLLYFVKSGFRIGTIMHQALAARLPPSCQEITLLQLYSTQTVAYTKNVYAVSDANLSNPRSRPIDIRPVKSTIKTNWYPSRHKTWDWDSSLTEASARGHVWDHDRDPDNGYSMCHFFLPIYLVNLMAFAWYI